MIKTFGCKETEKIFNMETSNKLPRSIQQRAYDKLLMLNNSASLIDLRVPPSNCLEKLGGDRKGQYSVRINAKRRICFEWIENHAYDVEIVDYH